MNGGGSGRPAYLTVGLISAAALGYELLLLRLFSIVQWHHFAALAITLALFGYGVSGTYLAIVERTGTLTRPSLVPVNGVLFGISAPVSYFAAGVVPFNGLELLWDATQVLWLAALFLVLALPFFFAANVIGLSLRRFPPLAGATYAADLLGAGVGALAVIAALFAVAPQKAILFAGVIGVMAAGLVLRKGRWPVVALAAFAAIGLLALDAPRLAISPYKGLSQALLVSGARLVHEDSSPLGLLSVVDSPAVPFRHAPGLSLLSPAIPPAQYGLFFDAGGMTAIDRITANDPSPDYLNQMTSALPYHMIDEPSTLLVGAGGGNDVLQALLHDVPNIDVVEVNPHLVQLLHGKLSTVLARPGVTVHVAEARQFLARQDAPYDLIGLATTDAFGGAGLGGMAADYLYTTEGIERMLERLKPGGLLAITRWVRLPPRGSAKLMVLLAETLAARGVTDPRSHVAAVRSWSTITVLAKTTPFSADEIDRLKRFAASRVFDLVIYPGMTDNEANRANRLDRPLFFEAATAILSENRNDFIRRYKYRIGPPSDAIPYFHNFFRWRILPELMEQRGRGGLGLVDWGYPLMAAATLVAALLGAGLIVAPLVLLPKQGPAVRASTKLRTFGYFLALGFGFMFAEIATIERFTLFLGHPVYAAASVLAGFLLFGGLGSFLSRPLADHLGARRLVVLATLLVGASVAIHLTAVGQLFAGLAEMALVVRILVALLVIAPLAMPMGAFLPLGMVRLGVSAPGLLPWAWALNGCASVLGAMLAALIAVHIGLPGVLLLSLAAYALAIVSLP